MLSLNQTKLRVKNDQYFQIIVMCVIIFICVTVIITLLYLHKTRLNSLKILKTEALNEKLTKIQREFEYSQGEREYKAHLQGYKSAQEYLSRELHDQIANTIAGIKLRIDTIDTKKNTKEALKHLSSIIETLYLKVRNLSHSLYTHNLEHHNISEFITEFVVQLSLSNNIKINWSVHPLEAFEQLNNDLKLFTITTLQELFLNCYKHSGATEVDLNINVHDTELLIIMNDNGVGFNKNNISKGGLNNIQWKVSKFNGQFTIDSQINEGATFTIVLPIKFYI